MSSAIRLPAEAHRYLPMAQTIAAAIRKRLELNVDVQDLIKKGAEGLEEAVTTFQRGHGTSFRIFAHYRIGLAIYRSLTETRWPSQDASNTYRFHQKADELMDWHSRSSDSMIKRTLDEEIIELKKLLRVLITSALLLWRRKENVLENLQAKERELLRLCFLQNVPLEQAALQLAMAKNAALRLQFQALQHLAAAMTLEIRRPNGV